MLSLLYVIFVCMNVSCIYVSFFSSSIFFSFCTMMIWEMSTTISIIKKFLMWLLTHFLSLKMIFLQYISATWLHKTCCSRHKPYLPVIYAIKIMLLGKLIYPITNLSVLLMANIFLIDKLSFFSSSISHTCESLTWTAFFFTSTYFLSVIFC